ncbi:M56 family metallopeptidase [Nonlabens sp. Asnod3-A02]|uniref:M56 family metallopeptidase n=1 Tax=Nonlabens sp. Asnod3-A02 TaxID=3160579 RepID=UPI00386EF62B
MIQHILHSSILAILFYGVYHLFLRKETFFQWNRAYLLAIPLLSITIPFLSAPFSIDMTPTVIDEVVPLASVDIGNVSMTSEQPIIMETSTPIDYTMIAVSIYSIGAFISLLFFLYNVSSIKEIIRKGTTHFKDGIWITKTSQKLTAFSFFKNIVIDENLDPKKVDEILNHEIIHVKQFHSWDLMAYEVYKILFWFHPICYIAQKELKQVHEYIVDHVLTKNQEPITYQESLLNTVFGAEQFSLASSYFNKSLLKNRILMLQKKKSTAKALFKLAFLFPIVLGSLIFTACNEEIETIEEQNFLINKEEKPSYLPRLSKFEYGKKDFYKGLSKNEITFYDSFLNSIKVDSITVNTIDQLNVIMKSEDGKRYSKISSIVNKNGESLIVDDVNENFNIIILKESPNRDPSYMTAPYSWNGSSVKSYVDGYLSGTFKDRVSELSDEQYRQMISRIVELHNEVNIEEIIEIEEVYPFSDEIDPDAEIISQDVPFAIIEEVPHFEDCKGTQTEIKKCTSEKIAKFVNKNFNTEIAQDLPGRHKIAVQFKIDKNGNVTGVQSKAKSIELQNEAARVINKLPKMIPGKQKGKAVTTIYALPIIFEIKE